ncbi:MAG TPA: hypothetical protein VLS89_20750, partial [Candidatus Nanopelagicales bacterium]|nr:hypothetical protein [Candidatus Nanopelagicales bacterium]
MKIESFRFHDRATGWQLEESTFDQFNLLVGVSGVGKSRILSSLGEVQRFAINQPRTTEDADWTIQFEHGGHRYRWEASVESPSEGEPEGDIVEAPERVVFAAETIVKDGRKLVERSDTSFDFEGRGLPKLKRSDSAITLLAEEPSIAPLREAFNSLIFSEAGAWQARTIYSRKFLEAVLGQHASIERLRETGRLSALIKSYLLQEVSPPEWDVIKELFTGIFPTVEDLRVDRSSMRLGAKA